MATCPNCGVHGYESDGTFTLDAVLGGQKLGSFSLSGSQIKYSAQARARLTCNSCGWSILGWIQGATFMADPITEHKPTTDLNTEE